MQRLPQKTGSVLVPQIGAQDSDLILQTRTASGFCRQTQEAFNPGGAQGMNCGSTAIKLQEPQEGSKTTLVADDGALGQSTDAPQKGREVDHLDLRARKHRRRPCRHQAAFPDKTCLLYTSPSPRD